MQLVKMMKKYAQLIARVGLNASIKQGVHIIANVETYPFVRYMVSALYNLKVRKVEVTYTDKVLEKYKIINTPDNKLNEVDNWEIQKLKEQVDEKMARLVLIGDDPTVFKKVPANKLGVYMKGRTEAFYELMNNYRNNQLTWCIAAVPTKEWAVNLFPELSPTQAFAKLWDAIYKACLVDKDNDPVEVYNDHLKTLEMRSRKLNSLNIKKLHYTNSLGTDLTITLPNKAIWHAAQTEEGESRKLFTPNIPTEEIFTSPDFRKTEGIVYSSKPLVYRGNIIDKFHLVFKNGKVIDYHAEVGEEYLKQIIEFDLTSNQLGEVALVPYDSPIQNLNIIFKETLLDENASCHLALGNSFRECYENGDDMEEIDLINKGLNISKLHVDFMIGTSDLKIEAVTYKNDTITIFEDGNFVI